MLPRAELRDPAVIAVQVEALREAVARSAGEFERGALAALCWLSEGGPGPVTGDVDGRRVVARVIVRELAAAEAVIYGAMTARTDFARGVEHALMWAQFVTCSTPAGAVTGGQSGENAPGVR